MSTLPTIPLGPYQLTRLIVGHNPICGLSHLTPELDCEMRDYYTPEQVVKVLHDCQAAGINTWLARGDYHRVLYWRELFRREGGELHWIGQTASEMQDVYENIRIMTAAGAIGIYHHGSTTDNKWHAGEIDSVQDYLKYIRDQGLQVGLASHLPEVIEYTEEQGWDVDFYMACFYQLSQKPRESGLVTGQGSLPENDLYQDWMPARMCETIRATDKTVLAFKILAAGRKCETQEQVKEAFRFTFANIKEKDAVVVGMFPKYEDQATLNAGYAREFG